MNIFVDWTFWFTALYLTRALYGFISDLSCMYLSSRDGLYTLSM